MAGSKKHIALFSLSLALLSLLLHGMIPHHHHDNESEQCNLDKHSCATIDTEILCTSVSCHFNCQQSHPNQGEAHICKLNVSDLKQGSKQMPAANIADDTFHYFVSAMPFFCTVHETLSISSFTGIKSLRAPPIGYIQS